MYIAAIVVLTLDVHIISYFPLPAGPNVNEGVVPEVDEPNMEGFALESPKSGLLPPSVGFEPSVEVVLPKENVGVPPPPNENGFDALAAAPPNSDLEE